MAPKKIYHRPERTREVKAGDILIAKPSWHEKEYEETIILICEHDYDVGTMGFILNMQSTLTVRDALEEMNIFEPLYYGGPSEETVISFIHNNAGIPGSINLGNGIFFGGDYELVKQMFREQILNLSQFRFLAGHVKWSPDQLEDEIGQGLWLLGNINLPELFLTRPSNLWSYKLLFSNPGYEMFSHLPDPCLN